MKIRVQMIVDDDEQTRRDIAQWDRTSFASDTLGLQLDEARALLQMSQQALVGAQVEAFLAKQVVCSHCGRAHRLKGRHQIVPTGHVGSLRSESPAEACEPIRPD